MTEENNFCTKFPSAKGTEVVNNQTTSLWDNQYTSRQRDNSGNNDKHTLPMIDMGASSGLVCRQRPKGAYCNSREHYHSQAHQIRNTSHIRTDSGLRDNESIYGSCITVSSASDFNRNKLSVNRCNMTQMAWSTEVYTENHRSHALRPITESCNSTKQPYSRNKRNEHNIEDRLRNCNSGPSLVSSTQFTSNEGLNDTELISSYVKDMKSSIESMKRGSAEHVTPNKPVSRFIKRTTDSDPVGTGASGINDANYAKEEIGLGNEISIITDRKTYDKIMKKNFTFERMCMSDRNSITLKGMFDFEEDTKFESDFFKIKSEDLKCEFNFPGSDIKFKVPIKKHNLVTDDEMVPLLKTLMAVVTDGDKWIKQTAQYSISYKQDIYCQDVKLLHKGDNLFQPKSNGFVTFSCSKLSSFCIISKPKKIKQIPYPHEGMKVKTGENGYLILEFPSKVENEIEYQVLPPIMGDIQTLDEYWKPKVLKAVSETLSLSYTERDQPPYVSFSESFMACEDPETIPKLIGYKPNGMPFYLPMNLKEGTKTLYKVENSSRVAFASVYKANMNNFSALKQELEVFYGRKVLCTLSLACKQLDGKLVLSTVCASPSDVAKCNANFVHSDSTIVWKSDALYMDPPQRLRISVGGCLTTLPGESKSHFFTFLNTSKQNIHSFPVAFKPGGVGYAIVEFSYDNINQGHPLAVIHFYPHHPFTKITAKIS